MMEEKFIFGPSLGDEIIAAGLGGLPFTWGSDGVIEGRESLTAVQNAKLDEVLRELVRSQLEQHVSLVTPNRKEPALRRAGRRQRVIGNRYRRAGLCACRRDAARAR